MENIVFEPIVNSTEYIALTVALAICIIILIISFFKKYKTLPMVTGLVTLILAGSIYMTWLADSKTMNLTVEKNKISQGSRNIQFRDIKNVFIDERTKSSLNPEATNNKERFLIIDISDGKPIVLPETVFPIDSMRSSIDRRYKAWKEAK